MGIIFIATPHHGSSLASLILHKVCREFCPLFRHAAAIEHEYKYSALPITAGFAGISGPSATFFGPNEGHGSAVVSAGVSVQLFN
jgi:hypothetical protein